MPAVRPDGAGRSRANRGWHRKHRTNFIANQIDEEFGTIIDWITATQCLTVLGNAAHVPASPPGTWAFFLASVSPGVMRS